MVFEVVGWLLVVGRAAVFYSCQLPARFTRYRKDKRIRSIGS